jgi:cadmium resistance protein CadD (predicted permease)
MFAVTNVDDIVLLALFFSQGSPPVRVVVGQYLGFAGILLVSILGALGAGLLPDNVIPYLGLLPLALGVKAAWEAWRERSTEERTVKAAPGVLSIAAITFANGGDNIGVYVPVFATEGWVVPAIVFLVLVGVWCAAGRFFATRPVVARALAKWGHVVLPIVLIGIGLLILLGA